jgi:hypothetical protein
VQATVAGGWYLAWWPGTQAATNAEVTTASGTGSVAFPATPALSLPDCPAGARCAAGYASGSGNGGPGSTQTTTSGGFGTAGSSH